MVPFGGRCNAPSRQKTRFLDSMSVLAPVFWEIWRDNPRHFVPWQGRQTKILRQFVQKGSFRAEKGTKWLPYKATAFLSPHYRNFVPGRGGRREKTRDNLCKKAVFGQKRGQNGYPIKLQLFCLSTTEILSPAGETDERKPGGSGSGARSCGGHR